MLVVIHNIRSAHNVGSIFRTADAAGCTKIYLCGVTPAPIDRFGRENTRLTKVSLGAEKYVSWKQVPSTGPLLDELRAAKHLILAIEQSLSSVSLYDFRLKTRELRRAVLVVGNERRGLSLGILMRANTIIEIPMSGRKESLNVSVAFGIAIFELLRPRRRRSGTI